ncbi:MAG: hypothetical protein ACFFDT_13680 [Candidatus Hodarchaeota archaeon]
MKWIVELPMAEDYDYLVKICIVCYPDDLLTPSLRSYVSGRFDPSTRSTLGSFFPRKQIKSTTGVNIHPKQIMVGTINIKLHVCDISTDPVFKPNYPRYFRGTSAVVFAFSKGNHSFIKATIDHYHEFRRLLPDVPVAFIGLSDESEVVSLVDGQSLAQELAVDYFEMAASDLQALDAVLRSLLKKILTRKLS